MNTNHLREIELKSCPGAKVTFKSVRSGIAAVTLNNKTSLIMAMYSKAKMFTEDSELHMDVLAKAEAISMDHDIAKMLFAIHSWVMPSEAFVLEMDNYPVDKGSFELLIEDVWAEINKIIDDLWNPKPLTEAEEKKDDTPSTSLPIPLRPE